MNSVLGSNGSFRIKGDSQICAIHLFFDNKLMLQDIMVFRFRKYIVIPDIGTRQRCQMRVEGNLKKLSFTTRIFPQFGYDTFGTRRVQA